MNYRAGVVGAAGFAGTELVRLLLAHPAFDVAVVTSDSLAGKPLSASSPAFSGASDLTFTAPGETDFSSCDVVFLAVPHTASLPIAPRLLAQGVSVVDLSADFRLKDPAVYEQWYKTEHTATDVLATAAFGLPEVERDEIERAARDHAQGVSVLVACAGCYPTATSLAAAPLIAAGLSDADKVVVVDAISGVTGAGKKATQRTQFCLANENLEAYGVASHRHTPEIEQILGLEGRLVFTPHLAPLNRGLLATVSLPVACDGEMPDDEALANVYEEFYAASPFVTVTRPPDLPRTSSVVGTNRAHVGAVADARTRMMIAVCAIDNLGKGAAGQAIQCANIVFGLPEDAGLGGLSCMA